MHGLVERSIDVIHAVDFDWREQPGECRGGFDRPCDGDMLEAGTAERRRCSRVEVGRDHEQLAPELAKVVAAGRRRKKTGQEAVESALVEQAGGNRAAQNRAKSRDRFQCTSPVRDSKLRQRSVRDQAGKREASTSKLPERRPQKKRARQRRIRAVIDEQTVHLCRRNAVRERCRDEAARRNTDVDVEVVEIDAVEGIGQRNEGADFVNAAQGPAARQGNTHGRNGGAFAARGALCRHGSCRYSVGQATRVA